MLVPDIDPRMLSKLESVIPDREWMGHMLERYDAVLELYREHALRYSHIDNHLHVDLHRKREGYVSDVALWAVYYAVETEYQIKKERMPSISKEVSEEFSARLRASRETVKQYRQMIQEMPIFNAILNGLDDANLKLGQETVEEIVGYSVTAIYMLTDMELAKRQAENGKYAIVDFLNSLEMPWADD